MLITCGTTIGGTATVPTFGTVFTSYKCAAGYMPLILTAGVLF